MANRWSEASAGFHPRLLTLQVTPIAAWWKPADSPSRLSIIHPIISHLLWTGHTGDLLKPTTLEAEGIKAVVQVALAEVMPSLSREILVAHFPIMDGAGNPPWVLHAVLDTTASLIRHKVPTLVCCSAGMSRSPCIAAGALALANGIDPDEALRHAIHDAAQDVSPPLWTEVCRCARTRYASG